jgi:hypothetical protein
VCCRHRVPASSKYMHYLRYTRYGRTDLTRISHASQRTRKPVPSCGADASGWRLNEPIIPPPPLRLVFCCWGNSGSVTRDVKLSGSRIPKEQLEPFSQSKLVAVGKEYIMLNTFWYKLPPEFLLRPVCETSSKRLRGELFCNRSIDWQTSEITNCQTDWIIDCYSDRPAKR